MKELPVSMSFAAPGRWVKVQGHGYVEFID